MTRSKSTANNLDEKKPAQVKGSDVKRTRRDRGEIEDIMFKLFERQPNWTLKQLVQETDQPANTKQKQLRIVLRSANLSLLEEITQEMNLMKFVLNGRNVFKIMWLVKMI